jgi:excisionase family DNA binding protein
MNDRDRQPNAWITESISRVVASMRGAERAKLLFTPVEAAVALAVSVAELERLIATGQLKAGKWKQRTLIHRNDIEAFARNVRGRKDV